jgi:hypothetical protein
VREFIQRLLGRSDIYFHGSRYMRRWLFGKRSTWGVRLHCIERSDADKELHDHPFWFASLILSGGYWEHTPDGYRKWYAPGSIVFRSADALHRLELALFRRVEPDGSVVLIERRAWTLVLRGRHMRRWGFLTSNGWRHWKGCVSEREAVSDAQEAL